jgi:hypothetical protein
MRWRRRPARPPEPAKHRIDPQAETAIYRDSVLAASSKDLDAAGLALYVGGWSICPTSKAFKKNWGTAEELLRLGIRVAQELGSPVFRAVLGTMEDRKTEGLALTLSNAENMVLPTLGWWTSPAGQHRAAQKWITALGVKCKSARQSVGELSGGNQQKIVVAREIERNPDLLLIGQPTRGVDIGAIDLSHLLR